MGDYFQIAIDGPVAAGKSTVARELAKKTGFVYVDTGAMYRAVTLISLRRGISVESEEALVKLVREIEIDVRSPNNEEKDGRLSTVLVDGEDVSWEIRGANVSKVVAKVAALPMVRDVLVPKQRKIAMEHDVVMEGRDITYVVLPDAELKIFLTAEEDVRIDRYHKKMMEENNLLSREAAAEMLRKRDDLDTKRETSPLRIVPDAWVLDTSNMSIEQVVNEVVERVGSMRE